MEPPPIALIKSNNSDKSDKYFVKIKFCKDTTSEKSDLCEFKMYFFDNSKPEEFLLFIHKFNMTIKALEIIKAGVNIQYLRTLVRGEALH